MTTPPPAPAIASAEDAALREQFAQIVYAAFPYDGKGPLEKPAWVIGGNSFMQERARVCADQIIDCLTTQFAAVRQRALEELATMEWTDAMKYAAIDNAPMFSAKEIEERQRRGGRMTMSDEQAKEMFRAVIRALSAQQQVKP